MRVSGCALKSISCECCLILWLRSLATASACANRRFVYVYNISCLVAGTSSETMPFISKDWRSPGEAWVKTQEGWEKKKVLENCRAIKWVLHPQISKFSTSYIGSGSIHVGCFFVLVSPLSIINSGYNYVVHSFLRNSFSKFTWVTELLLCSFKLFFLFNSEFLFL